MTSGGKRFEHRRFLGLKVVATRTEIGGCSSNSEPAQLVPADRDAGASGAGAVSYVDLQLTNHLGRYQRAYQEHIAVGKEKDTTMFEKYIICTRGFRNVIQ